MATQKIQIADKPTLDTVKDKVDSLAVDIPQVISQKAASISRNVMNTSDTVIQMPYSGDIAVGDIVRYNANTDEIYSSTYMSDDGLVSLFTSNHNGDYDAVIKNPKYPYIYYGVKVEPSGSELKSIVGFDLINTNEEKISAFSFEIDIDFTDGNYSDTFNHLIYNTGMDGVLTLITYCNYYHYYNKYYVPVNFLTLDISKEDSVLLLDSLKTANSFETSSLVDYNTFSFLSDKYILNRLSSYYEISISGKISAKKDVVKNGDYVGKFGSGYELTFTKSLINYKIGETYELWMRNRNKDYLETYYNYTGSFDDNMVLNFTYTNYNRPWFVEKIYQLSNRDSIGIYRYYDGSNSTYYCYFNKGTTGYELTYSSSLISISKPLFLNNIKIDSTTISDDIITYLIGSTVSAYKISNNTVSSFILPSSVQTLINSSNFITQHYLANTLFMIRSDTCRIQYTTDTPTDSIYGICKLVDSNSGIANIAMSGICKINKNGSKGLELPNLGIYVTKNYINLTEVINDKGIEKVLVADESNLLKQISCSSIDIQQSSPINLFTFTPKLSGKILLQINATVARTSPVEIYLNGENISTLSYSNQSTTSASVTLTVNKYSSYILAAKTSSSSTSVVNTLRFLASVRDYDPDKILV